MSDPAPDASVLAVAGKGIEGESEPVEMEEVAEKVDGGDGHLPGLGRPVQPGEPADLLDRLRLGARGAALALQRQPPPPPPPPVVPAGRATLNFLPILQDRVPASWGVTGQDRAVIDITAYADGATWKSKITTADQQTHQGIRLLAGVVEVTPALVAAETSCPTLQTMITSLDTVANQGTHSGFYMTAAVQAHENLHVSQWRTGMAPHYATLRTAVEALTVPFASHADATSAKAAIKALPGFTTAMATYRAGETTVASATASHSPIAPFNAVEHAVVDPMITTIRARRTALKCAP